MSHQLRVWHKVAPNPAVWQGVEGKSQVFTRHALDDASISQGRDGDRFRPRHAWESLKFRHLSTWLPSNRGLGNGQGLQKALQLAAAHRILQLSHRFGLDLPNAFAGDFENSPDLLQRIGVSIP